MPSSAIWLNSGEKINCAVNLCPSDHESQQPYLRLRNIPVKKMTDTVLVAKLVFDRPLNQILKADDSKNKTESLL